MNPLLKKLLQTTGWALLVALFGASIVALHRELYAIHYHQVLAAIDDIPNSKLFLAIALTGFNLIILGGYEILGFRYIKSKLPGNKILLTSIIASSFSNTVGFSSISGSAVRSRIYSQEGLSTVDIAKLSTFSSVFAFWFGLAAIVSTVFLFNPVGMARAWRLPVEVPTAVGASSIACLVFFGLVAAFAKKPVLIRSWKVESPTLSQTISLFALGCLDWITLGGALYTFLPTGSISFWTFMAAFLFAQLAGTASRIPGGFGVFEAVFIYLVPGIPPLAAVAALVLFRGVYYFLPLAVSAILLGAYELFQRNERIGGFALAFGQWARGVVPYFFGVMIFIGGSVLLFSGAMPAEHHRMHWLIHVMPLPVLEISHFLASVIGMALLILSAGIYRRYDSAWHLTLYLLAGGAIFTFLKGIDYEEAMILSCMFAVLLPSRREFYRKGSFTHDWLTPGWLAAVVLTLASSVWLGFFASKHVTFSNELWWQFSFGSHASRFLRASVGAGVLLFGYGFIKLLARVRVRISEGSEVDLESIAAILAAKSCHIRSYLALLGDKSFLVSESNDAFIMYGVAGRSWVAMSDPVGNETAFASLIWQFKELCDRHGAWPVFHEIGNRHMDLYLDIGLTLLKVGEEARIDAANFSLEGSDRKGLRYYSRRLAQEGWKFEVVPSIGVAELLPRLRPVSDAWLAAKNTREKRFSLGCFNEAYLSRLPMGLVRRGDEIVAFANLWLTATREEYSIDLMRYSPAAPDGIMDFLFVHLLLWGKNEGYAWFDMGMAPFSGIEDRSLSPFWNKLAAFIYAHGEDFYNFQGLRKYKEKFDPLWQPRYLAVPGGLSLPLILKDLSALTSGGLKGMFGK